MRLEGVGGCWRVLEGIGGCWRGVGGTSRLHQLRVKNELHVYGCVCCFVEVGCVDGKETKDKDLRKLRRFATASSTGNNHHLMTNNISYIFLFDELFSIWFQVFDN